MQSHFQEFNLGQAFDMIMQVVTGMCYLSSQRIIHRDLAARNCMLSADRKVIKINDFGLGRKLIIKTYYSQNSNTELPVCWTALECLMGGAVGFCFIYLM
jgi:serine/threonine protein kinase